MNISVDTLHKGDTDDTDDNNDNDDNTDILWGPKVSLVCMRS
jgi:hypothetical protein